MELESTEVSNSDSSGGYDIEEPSVDYDCIGLTQTGRHFVVKKDGMWRLINKYSGNIYGDEFETIDFFKELYGYRYFVAKKDGKFCIVKEDGQIVSNEYEVGISHIIGNEFKGFNSDWNEEFKIDPHL